MKIARFVLDGFPALRHEHVIAPAALASMRIRMPWPSSTSDGGRTGELTALIGVHDLRYAMAENRILKRFHASIGRQAVGYASGEHPPACVGLALQRLD